MMLPLLAATLPLVLATSIVSAASLEPSIKDVRANAHTYGELSPFGGSSGLRVEQKDANAGKRRRDRASGGSGHNVALSINWDGSMNSTDNGDLMRRSHSLINRVTIITSGEEYTLIKEGAICEWWYNDRSGLETLEACEGYCKNTDGCKAFSFHSTRTGKPCRISASEPQQTGREPRGHGWTSDDTTKFGSITGNTGDDVKTQCGIMKFEGGSIYSLGLITTTSTTTTTTSSTTTTTTTTTAKSDVSSLRLNAFAAVCVLVALGLVHM